MRRRVGKTIFIILLSALSAIASATNYYVSSSGNDSSTGQSESSPWKTIDKVNAAFSSLNPGDRILFRRGDTFYGTIQVTKSGLAGSPITIGAYGSGNDPVITGLINISSWTNEGNGIYSTTLNGISRLEIVIVDNIQYWMGQYPQTGYLTYESFNSNLSITDYDLPSTPNWTGAEIFIRKNNYATSRATITNHSSSIISYSEINGNTIPLTNKYGYIIQNDQRTLRDFGDWCYRDSKLYMYFGSYNPVNYDIRVANIQDLLYINSKNYIIVENINLKGCNNNGINITSCKYITVSQCKIEYIGSRGLNVLWYNTCSNITVENSEFKKINGNAVEIFANNIVFTNNKIDSIGMIRGACYGTNNGNGLYGRFENGLIQYNVISNTGHNGIYPSGNNVKIINNYIYNTVFEYLDGGAIYITHNGSKYIGQEIKNNIIIDALGGNWGTDNYASFWVDAEGIFLDSYTDAILVDGNTIANCNQGIKLFEAQGTIIKNNTLFNNNWQINLVNSNARIPLHPLREISINNNIAIAKEAAQLVLHFSSVENDINLFGTSDINYFARPIDDDDVFKLYQPSVGTKYMTLSGWQSFTGQDINSNKSPVALTNINELRFEYNASKVNKVVSLDKPMIDIKGTKYQNSITLLPYTSAVLLVDPNPPQTNGCINEIFTAASGTITDNSGASAYLDNMSCQKLIQPAGAVSIKLTFNSFNTESGYDFVRIYDGSTTSAPLLGEFSGTNLPPVLNSSGGSMLITFTTDKGVTAAGWSATYTSVISNTCVNETFTALSGTLSDNSGTADYLNNMSCEKLIQPAGAGSIILTFDSFKTETGYDFVRIYDGATTSATLLGEFSGSNLPPVITSGGGSMLIKFTTDKGVTAAGWSATYTSVLQAACVNETFTALSGTVSDNSGTADYLNNMSCEKLIQPGGAGSVILTFDSFKTETGYDFVRIYDGATTSATLLGEFSGSNLPPVITSSGGSMLIKFTTDKGVTATGWSANYTSVLLATCNNETFTAPTGTVSDNSGPSEYLNNMSCDKLIQPPGAGYITLTFNSFRTEYYYDAVTVYDGPTISSPVLGRYSGNSLPPSIRSTGGSMLIRFITDRGVTADGWSATYTSAALGICTNETFTAGAGTISDNSGSSDYLNNMDCSKLIQPTGAQYVILSFTSFDIENYYDMVYVYDGTTQSSPLLGKFSGSNLPPALTSTGGSMLIRFTTDRGVTADGWSATYTSGVFGDCINETFTASSGIITDNSGAMNYTNYLSCEKLIQPTGATFITLNFTSFNVEYYYDVVTIYDGATTSSPVLGRFSGNTIPPPITSSGGSMLIKFTTDRGVVAQGWSATYTSSSSGGSKGAKQEATEQENLFEPMITEIIAFPNPTTDKLTVETPFIEETTFLVDLIDPSGKTVFQENINVTGGKFVIEMSDYIAGYYFLSIKTGNVRKVMRIIKNTR